MRTRVASVKCKDGGGVEGFGGGDRGDELGFDLVVLLFALAFDVEPPAHEAEREAVEELGGHDPPAAAGDGDVDVAVNDHKAPDARTRPASGPAKRGYLPRMDWKRVYASSHALALVGS